MVGKNFPRANSFTVICFKECDAEAIFITGKTAERYHANTGGSQQVIDKPFVRAEAFNTFFNMLFYGRVLYFQKLLIVEYALIKKNRQVEGPAGLNDA